MVSTATDTLGRPGPGLRSDAVRTANTELVAALLRERGPLSRADLVRESGLTRPTVMAIVTSLLADGIAKEAAGRAAGPDPKVGRPGTLLEFNARSTVAAVCRIRLGTCDATLVDALGRVITESTTSLAPDPSGLLPGLARQIRRLARAAPDAGPLGAVSVLAAGVEQRPSGAYLSSAVHGWTSIPVEADLRRHLRVPVSVLSPPAAAVLGETLQGAARGHRDVILIFLDRGIGVGVLTGGRLLRGTQGAVGELGHCRVVNPGVACACGRSGCLETVASGQSILNHAQRILGRSVSDASSLAELAALGNARINRMLATSAAALGTAASWLVNLLNPSTVILGGTPFAAGAYDFLDTFADAVRENTIAANRDILNFALASAEADLRGAVRLALEQLPVWLRPRERYGA